MSEKMGEKATVVGGPFGQSVRVRQAAWYGRNLIELLPVRAAKEHGGQVLLTPEDAVDLIAVLSQAVADARAADPGIPPDRPEATQ